MRHLYLLNDATHAMIVGARKVSGCGDDEVIQAAFRLGVQNMTPDQLARSVDRMRMAGVGESDIEALREWVEQSKS